MATSETVTFGAVGDIAFHHATGSQMLALGAAWPFADVQSALSRADLLFGNMESVVIPDDFPVEKIAAKALISRVPGTVAARALRQAGFDIMNMAANHVLDAGTVGLAHTRQTLVDAGIRVGGVGATAEEARALQIVEKRGVRFGFLCYCEPNNCTLQTRGPTHAVYETERVIEDVRANRGRVDLLVVSIHADIEFTPTPSVPRQASARRIAEAGASIILQHHPHVPQGIEWHAGCLIAYSLGNFIFPAHTSAYQKTHGPGTAESMILLMRANRSGVQAFERVPVIIGEPPEERPRLAQGAVRDALLARFDELDRMLADPATVRRVWRETVRDFLAGYQEVVRNLSGSDPDYLIENILPRFLYLAENRNVMNEAAAMAREHWDRVLEQDVTWQRPQMRAPRTDA